MLGSDFFTEKQEQKSWRFFNLPFVYICLSFILGITLRFFGLNSSSAYIFVIFITIYFCFIHFTKFFRDFQLLLSTLLFFIAIGVFSCEIYLNPPGQTNLEQMDVNDEFLIVEIIETPASKTEKWQKCIAEVKGSYTNQFEELNGKLLLYFNPESPINLGDRILLQSDLIAIQNSNNIGEFDAVWYWKTKNISKMAFVSDQNYIFLSNHISWFQKLILSIRNYASAVLSENLSGDTEEVSLALLLGDRSRLSQETSTSFSNSGIIHLLAVSGLHIGILYGMLLFVFQLFSRFITKKAAIVSIVIILFVYAGVTGFSPSVLRAVFMFSIFGMSEFIGGNQNKYNTLCFSAFILLLFNPLLIFDIGFQLSYLAVLSIFFFYRKIFEFLESKNKVFNFIWSGVALGIAAQILTIPLTIYYFHQFPNYFIISNLSVILLVAPTVILGMLLMILGKIPLLSTLIKYAFIFCLLAIIHTSFFIESLPGSVAKGFQISIGAVFLLFFLIFLFLIFQNNLLIRRLIGLSLIACVLLFQFQRYQRKSGNFIYFPNTKFQSLALKLKDKTQFYYVGGERQFKQIKLIADNFEKIYECETEIVQIQTNKKSVISSQKYKFELTVSKHALSLSRKEDIWTRTPQTIYLQKSDLSKEVLSSNLYQL